MQITFDTTTITDDEVRGIFALLDTVRPAAFDPGPFSESEMERVVEEKLSGSVKLAEEPVSTFDGEEFPQSPVPPTHDVNGLPWDERIHSGTKALNADGTWRTKRGVDKALVASVEAELRSRTTVTQEVTETGVDEEGFVTIETVVTVAPPAPEAPKAPLAPVAAASETEAPTPPATSTQAASTTTVSPFVALMKRVTTAQGAGKLTQPRVKELLESLDKKSIMDLRTDTDALDAFAVLLDGEGV